MAHAAFALPEHVTALVSLRSLALSCAPTWGASHPVALHVRFADDAASPALLLKRSGGKTVAGKWPEARDPAVCAVLQFLKGKIRL